ncbi:MAG TPA: hypothetical protein PKD91_14450 [Bacteroidia bacterium]|nr:hypothetical protein [Bacteroidia bacterium]
MTKYLIVAFLCIASFSFGQQNPFEYEEEKPPLLKKEFSFGLTIHTSGWGVDFRKGKNITGYKKRVLEAELVNMKHSKEIRSVNPYFDNAKSFFYGKQNTFTVLRTGIGQHKVMFSKAEKGGVEVRLNYTAGLSLGFAKPVYLNILYPTAFESQYEVVVEKYDPERHYVDNIYGRAPFTEGISEIKIYPGGYGKLGLSFEYGTYSEDIKLIEVGASLDAYGKEVPIMAYAKNNQFFFNFYITLMYGRKW